MTHEEIHEEINVEEPEKAVAYLRNPQTIREHAQQIFTYVAEGHSPYFSFHPERFPDLTNFVIEVIQRNYPSFEIPLHSRFRHFHAGGIDRLGKLCDSLAKRPLEERRKTLCAFVTLSVFLDAGAGETWKYRDESSAQILTRSEGLAVASLRMFENGLFSSDAHDPLRVDGEKLSSIDEEDLGKAFQVTEQNKLVGLKGRCHLLRSLGPVFSKGISLPSTHLSASHLLQMLLETFSGIWPHGPRLAGTPLGDVDIHPNVVGRWGTDRLVPFHKLTQWLAYSLVEPLELSGVQVTDLEQLTGLPEYRNGGLFLDHGVIALNDVSLRKKAHSPHSELVVEWRALTIALLDRLAVRIREVLRKTQDELPLARILQGGTWEAGRRLAFKLRKDGSPPLRLESDGTIF